jgi:hypothetical protein
MDRQYSSDASFDTYGTLFLFLNIFIVAFISGKRSCMDSMSPSTNDGSSPNLILWLGILCLLPFLVVLIQFYRVNKTRRLKESYPEIVMVDAFGNTPACPLTTVYDSDLSSGTIYSCQGTSVLNAPISYIFDSSMDRTVCPSNMLLTADPYYGPSCIGGLSTSSVNCSNVYGRGTVKGSDGMCYRPTSLNTGSYPMCAAGYTMTSSRGCGKPMGDPYCPSGFNSSGTDCVRLQVTSAAQCRQYNANASYNNAKKTCVVKSSNASCNLYPGTQIDSWNNTLQCVRTINPSYISLGT